MSGIITEILRCYGSEPDQLGHRLLPVVYEELRSMARQQMGRERRRITLQPTALVHETYLRLLGSGSFRNRRHFFAACARAMRRILVEHARRRGRRKRGGGLEALPLEEGRIGGEGPREEVLALTEALRALESVAPRKALVVELRYLAGFTIAETAAALGVSPATVKADWSFARAWLHRRIASRPASERRP